MLICTEKCTKHIFSFLLAAQKYVIYELILYDYCNALWLVFVMIPVKKKSRFRKILRYHLMESTLEGKREIT